MPRYSGPVPHGTANGYTNYRCRCAECREAWRTYHAANRARHPKWAEQHARHERVRRWRLGHETYRRLKRPYVDPRYFLREHHPLVGGYWLLTLVILYGAPKWRGYSGVYRA